MLYFAILVGFLHKTYFFQIKHFFRVFDLKNRFIFNLDLIFFFYYLKNVWFENISKQDIRAAL